MDSTQLATVALAIGAMLVIPVGRIDLPIVQAPIDDLLAQVLEGDAVRA